MERVTLTIVFDGPRVVSQSFLARDGERFLGFGERSHAVSVDHGVIENYVGEGPFQPHEYQFPHEEGTFPFTRERLANTYSSMDPAEVARMVGVNAAHVYGFDFDHLDEIAAEIGPEIAQVEKPIDRQPDTLSLAFESRSATVS